MAKVRFQMFIEPRQKEALERIQEDSKIPVAEIIRKAVDLFLSEWKRKKKIPIEDEMTERLLSIAGTCKDGPKDLADEHDKYLYGVSRK
ncbi:MAG: ribbon-helix-helix domain-containing protein [Nitrospirae bacterium]|nr:ribbon-helix-helix domain-containing protein [Nitrospirota bacterium]